MPEPGTFLQQFNGLSGPARAIIDRGESSELVLPSTHGDATVEATEETYEVTYDENGNAPSEVYSFGQRFEINYPMKHADLEAFFNWRRWAANYNVEQYRRSGRS